MIISNPKKPSKIQKVTYNDDDKLPESLNFAKNLTKTDFENDIILKTSIQNSSLKLSSVEKITVPVMVSFQTPAISFETRPPIDLITVIDHSGSMAGKPMKVVKEAFESLISYLSPNDRLSVIIFDDTAKRLSPLMCMTEENKQFIMDKIKGVIPDGGTDIHLGLYHAFETIKQRKYKNPVTSIFLLSDGLDKEAQREVETSLANFESNENFSINTFGFSKEHDPNLMKNLAELKDGNFYFIDNIDVIDGCFIDCLGGLLSVIGKDCTISIKPEISDCFEEKLKIKKAFGGDSLWKSEKGEYTTKILQVVSGQKKDFVLELTFPEIKKILSDDQKYVPILKAYCSFSDLNEKFIEKTSELSIYCFNESEESKLNEIDQAVSLNYYRVKVAEALEQARILADEQNFVESKKILGKIREELKDSLVSKEDVIKNLLFDVEKSILDLEPEVYKDHGKHYMISNARAHMQQRSNPMTAAMQYQNKNQAMMVEDHFYSKKSKKESFK